MSAQVDEMPVVAAAAGDATTPEADSSPEADAEATTSSSMTSSSAATLNGSVHEELTVKNGIVVVGDDRLTTEEECTNGTITDGDVDDEASCQQLHQQQQQQQLQEALSRVRTASSCPSVSSTGTAPEELLLPSMVPSPPSANGGDCDGAADSEATRYDTEELRLAADRLLPADSLLPGEWARFVGSDSAGVVLVLTNYRLLLLLVLRPAQDQEHQEQQQHQEAILLESLPACIIERLHLSDGLQMQLQCKDGRSLPRLAFESLNDLTRWAERLDPSRLSPLLDCHGATYFSCLFKKAVRNRQRQQQIQQFCERFDRVEFGYAAHFTERDFAAEAARLGLNDAARWRVTRVNADRALCPSYPRLHAVPCDVTDEEVAQSSSYRAQARFPTAVWQCRATGAALARSAQPLVGLAGFLGWRCEPDEKLVRLLSPDPAKKVLIVDARHYTSALGNGTRGGGYERPEYYSGTEIEYLGLPNIHAVRTGFAALRQALSTAAAAAGTSAASDAAASSAAAAAVAPPPPAAHGAAASFLSDVEKSGWLALLAALLRHASRIAQVLVSEGRSVLVHCSDGWDRTPQLTSLCLLLADPHYRSLDGFRLLLNREWFEFGHKFADRCSGKDANERSPIFLQFLDCVHQLLLQFPTQFEFTEALLRRLAVHAFSGLFSSFLSNSPAERDDADLKSRGLCVWNVVSLRGMRNQLYRPATGVLSPAVSLHCLHVWRGLYMPEQPGTFDRLDWDGLPIAWDPFQEQLHQLSRELRASERQKRALEERLGGAQAAAAAAAAAAAGGVMGVAGRRRGGDSGSSSEPSSLESAEIVDDCDIDAGIVRWVPDHLRHTCAGCHAAFTQLLRRHHCRACGDIFCYKCADYYVPLPDQFLRDRCRVCKFCHERHSDLLFEDD